MAFRPCPLAWGLAARAAFCLPLLAALGLAVAWALSG